jgi:uncharacterized DUF497 family protein
MPPVAEFDWDDGSRNQCQRHGVSIVEIETLFRRAIVILPDAAHSVMEEHFSAEGKTEEDRHVVIALTLRVYRDVFYSRPISARDMYRREIESDEEENPNLRDIRTGQRMRFQRC